MELLVKLSKNSLHGEQIRKNFAFKSEAWMMGEHDERGKDYWKFGFGNYIVK